MKPTAKKNLPAAPRLKKSDDSVEKARELHDRGVLIRGEAAKRDKDGKLPSGATHELVDGKPVRARYRIS